MANRTEDMLEEIFNDHEAQLKAKDDEIKDLQTAMIKLNEHYHIAKNELKAELKAKDEEIERLNCRAYHAEGYINDLHNHPKDKKFYDAKARSIVAMLFWEWRREADDFGRDKACICFEKAYAMLKDNQ